VGEPGLSDKEQARLHAEVGKELRRGSSQRSVKPEVTTQTVVQTNSQPATSSPPTPRLCVLR